jgi:hypothetical protein
MRGLERFSYRTGGALEEALAPRHDRFQAPPLIIIGSPRSGSTLLSQVLINAFRFGYLSNLHRYLHMAPYLLQRGLGWALPERELSYRSQLGFTEGLLGPSSCDLFWYRWFPREPHYASLDDVDVERLRGMRRVLIGLTESFGSPLLLKSLVSGLRLRPLAAVLPEARFLVLHRDPALMAQSILLVRQEVNGRTDRWWSLQPPGWRQVRELPAAQQVLRQIADIYRVIREDAAAFPPGHFLELRYEAFCRDVRGTLEAVRAFVEQDGVRLQPRREVPASFPVSERVRLPSEEFDELRRGAEELFGIGVPSPREGPHAS